MPRAQCPRRPHACTSRLQRLAIQPMFARDPTHRRQHAQFFSLCEFVILAHVGVEALEANVGVSRASTLLPAYTRSQLSPTYGGRWTLMHTGTCTQAHTHR